MADGYKILIVDNDKELAQELSRTLTGEFYSTQIAGDGMAALQLFETWEPDLILLDAMLPGKDGYQICQEIRHASQVPIIMVSSRSETIDKVLGLELGADDFVGKPFDSKELVARIKAVLRRTSLSGSQPEKEKCVDYPDLVINMTNYSVIYKGVPVEMPPKELELLYFLASSPNQVFTRDQLLRNIWGHDYVDARTVDVHIKRIRQKLQDSEHWALTTVWRVGYKFETR